MPKFSKDNNSENILFIYIVFFMSSVDLLIPDQALDKQLAQIFFEMSCEHIFNANIVKRQWHRQKKLIFTLFFIQSGDLLIIPYQLTKFKALSLKTLKSNFKYQHF